MIKEVTRGLSGKKTLGQLSWCRLRVTQAPSWKVQAIWGGEASWASSASPGPLGPTAKGLDSTAGWVPGRVESHPIHCPHHPIPTDTSTRGWFLTCPAPAPPPVILLVCKRPCPSPLPLFHYMSAPQGCRGIYISLLASCGHLGLHYLELFE